MSAYLHSLVDGQATDSLPLGDRALHYGDGVFRTMLLWQGRIVWLEQQLQHLEADARRIGLHAPAPETLAADLQRLASGRKRGVVKLVLSAGDSPRGYARAGGPCRRIALLSDLPDWPREYWQDGIAIASLDLRLAEQPVLAGAKHLNRLEQVMARRQWPPGCQEGLLGNTAGELICGTMSNVFWCESGRWFTPPITQCGVSGVTRERLLQLAPDIAETRQPIDAVANNCEAMFLCNALTGIWPVRVWDGRNLPRSKAIEASLNRLRAALAHPLTPDTT